MGIGTYEQYKERLLKMKPNVYLNGRCVDTPTEKKALKGTWLTGSKAGPM